MLGSSCFHAPYASLHIGIITIMENFKGVVKYIYKLNRTTAEKVRED